MPNRDAYVTYPPLNTCKPVADDIWIVDGPAIRFGMPWPKLPFATRMTVIRLRSGDLFVHSPTPPTPALRAEIEEAGRVRFLIAPCRTHYFWLPDWKAAYPEAEVYLAPRVREQAKDRIDFDGHPLEAASGYPWDEEIATLPLPGGYVSEVVFFHRPSRTLLLTDLIVNLEPEKTSWLLLRLLAWVGGVSPPHGGISRDLRANYTRHHKRELRAAAETMLAWNPERIVFAHGRWFPEHGADELQRAFAWLLRET
jgi:hypothetical protein